MRNSVFLAVRRGERCVPAPFGPAARLLVEPPLDRPARRQPAYTNNSGPDLSVFDPQEAAKPAVPRLVVRFGAGRYSNRVNAFFVGAAARS
jgi:hypothetical protein